MLKTVDLFAGAGGLSLGFHRTGRIQIIAAAEINANAAKTYLNNFQLVNDGKIEWIKNIVGYDFRSLIERQWRHRFSHWRSTLSGIFQCKSSKKSCYKHEQYFGKRIL